MYITWMYIGSRIRIYVHIILYTYTVMSLYRFLSEIAGRKDECRTSLALLSGTERNHDIVLSPPFSWTSIVLSQGCYLKGAPR